MNQTRRTNGGLALPALLLTLLLCAVQIQSRPSTENEADVAALPPDADNVELHHVKLVDGIMTEDHPIVMYKEDFVNEDYDPAKNQTKRIHHRKYEHVKRTRHHHSRPNVEKPQEKIRFDVLSETPIFNEDLSDDSDPYNFEAASLMEPSKGDTQQKYPKKYHSRQRRQVYFPSERQSYNYNPYYDSRRPINYRSNAAPGNFYLPAEQPRQFQRYPVPGKKPIYKGKLPIWRNPTAQPQSIGNRDNFEDESNNLFHNSNPDDADFSVFDRPRPETTTGGQGSRPPPASNSNGWQSPPLNGWQSPPEEVQESRPVWGQSTGRRPNNSAGNRAPASASAPAPIFSRPRPVYRQDALLYPEEPSYQEHSACHRASLLCCNLGNLASLYDCFQHQNCEDSLSQILSTCS